MTRLSAERIEAAYLELLPEFRDSPQYRCEELGQTLGCDLTVKDETQNPIRCFKGRGTQIALKEAIRNDSDTVVCASAGNLGQAVAYCAEKSGIASVVFASSTANPLKLQRMAELGASLRLVDGDIELARNQATEFAASEKAFLIEDSENISTCEGAGTIGIEMTNDTSPEFDAVLVSLGAGAMATGIGTIFKDRKPRTEVICIQPRGAPAMTRSWHEKRVVQTDSIDTIADGVAGRFPIQEVLSDLLQVIDDAVLVEEESIISGMRLIYRHAGLVVEPSAALGIAAILESPERFAGKHVATVLCGGNVEPSDFERWVIDAQSH